MHFEWWIFGATWMMMSLLMLWVLWSHKIAWLMIVIGSFAWCLVMVRSGVLYDYGLGFWGPHGHDAVWHLSLIEHLSEEWSRELPMAAGENLQNYHFGYDVIQALIHRVTGIPNRILYFQILPVVTSMLVGGLSYAISMLLSDKLLHSPSSIRIRSGRLMPINSVTRNSGLFTLLLIYFGGSAGWLISFMNGEGWGGETMFWSQQAISTLINPPFVLSLLLMMIGFLGWYKARRGAGWWWCVVLLSWGVLVQIKVYAAMLTLTAWGLVWLYEVLLKLITKSETDSWGKLLTELLMIFLTSLIGLGLVLPFSSFESGSVFVWKPGWFIQTMLLSQDKFYSERLWNIWNSPSLVKQSVGLSFGLILFLVGNMWLRVYGLGFGIAVLVRSWFSTQFVIWRWWMMVILLGLLVPLFFIQSGTAWNTIQFTYYGLFGLALVSGVGLSRLSVRLNLGEWGTFILFVPILLLNIPTSVAALQNYLPSRPPAAVSVAEYDALLWLKDQDDGVVLTGLYNTGNFYEFAEPRPMWVYVSNPYVSMLSGKNTYLEDEINLEITGIDWRARRSEVERLWNEQDREQIRRWLSRHAIRYIYLPNEIDVPIAWHQWPVTMVYTNDEVSIYRVNSNR